jgi:hypothetical protein
MPVKSIFVFAKRLYTQKVDGQKKVTDDSLDRTHDTPWTAQLSEKGLKDLKFCIEQSGFKGDASRVAFQQACWGDMTQGGTGIPMDYLATAIMNADILMFQFDVNKSGNRGSLRGFCCIKYKLDQKAEAKGISVPYLYVDLICNGPLASVRASLNKASPPGAYMLAIAKALATGTKVGSITIPRMEAVQLRALETVVGYYPIFGWRFLSKGVYEACRRKKGESKKIEAARKKLAKAFQKGNLTDDEKRDLLAPFAPWLDDFAGPAPSIKEQGEAVKDADTTTGKEGTHEAVIESKRGDGYMMVKCLLGNDETKVMAEVCEEGEKKKGVLRLHRTWEAVKTSGTMVAYYGKRKKFDKEWDDEDADDAAWRETFPRLYRASLSPGSKKEEDDTDSDDDSDEESSSEEEADEEEADEEEEPKRQGDHDREPHDAGRSRHSRIRVRNCECRCRSYGKKRTKKRAPIRSRNRRLTRGRSRPRGGRRTRRRR